MQRNDRYHYLRLLGLPIPSSTKKKGNGEAIDAPVQDEEQLDDKDSADNGGNEDIDNDTECGGPVVLVDNESAADEGPLQLSEEAENVTIDK